MKRILTAIGLLLWLSTSALAQDGLTGLERKRVSDLVDQTLRDKDWGAVATLDLAWNLKVFIRPGAVTSQATGQLCDRCKDWCRQYSVVVEQDRGAATTAYAGERCVVRNGQPLSSAAWTDRSPLALSIAPNIYSEARSYLFQFKYLQNPLVTPSELFDGLSAFRFDAKLASVEGFQILQRDIDELRATAKRSRPSQSCGAPRPYTGCGEMN